MRSLFFQKEDINVTNRLSNSPVPYLIQKFINCYKDMLGSNSGILDKTDTNTVFSQK